MISKFFLVVVLVLCICGCKPPAKTTEVGSLPYDLTTSMTAIEKEWSVSDKTIFKNQTESEAVTVQHFSTGLWIRNNWIRGNRDTVLTNYFYKLGVSNPDDISSIILTSLHRKLNNKPLELNKLVKASRLYWESINNCEKNTRINAFNTYQKLKVGDAITILMSVDTSDNHRNAVTYACPTINWKFDLNKDLEINAILKEKYVINSDSNVFIKAQITRLSNSKTDILMSEAKVGGIVDLSLMNLKVVKQ
jgi:hypothetical protein